MSASPRIINLDDGWNKEIKVMDEIAYSSVGVKAKQRLGRCVMCK